MVNSTQQFISIAGVKDGIIILKDGSYRLILQVASANFALKSEQEQNSVIMQYQSFLNSLHFPIEVVIRSKRLDLAPYIKKIEEQVPKQDNELIKMQTEDYIGFISKLVDVANIMKKSFYVVVPFTPTTINKSGLFEKVFKKESQVFDKIRISDEEYKKNTAKLKERANIVASGLGSMGLHCFQLSSANVIELFYQIYNPNEAAKERLSDPSFMSASVVSLEEDVNQDAPESKTDLGMIDNSSIVSEQKKQEAEFRKIEELKQTEKEVRNPESEISAATAKEEKPKDDGNDKVIDGNPPENGQEDQNSNS